MKLICGPMATISHPAFRILIEKFGGCDEYFTEMINAGSLVTGGPFEKYYIDPSPDPSKLVWQLTGHSIDYMLEATEILCKLPGIGIDINMGCSAPDIYRFGAGIGWMLKPIEETRQLIKETNSVIQNYNNSSAEKKRFSVKLRLGDDNFNDESFFSFCDMLIEEGVEMLTLHPRTKKEKLARPARYHYCQDIALRYKKNNIPVILNGNVKDVSSAEYAFSKAPDVNGIMISRAAVEKPWIFAQLKRDFLKTGDFSSLKNIDMFQLALDFISDVEKYQPKEFWKTRLQRYFTYYGNTFLFSHYAQTMFINASDNDDLRNRLARFFEENPGERYKSF